MNDLFIAQSDQIAQEIRDLFADHGGKGGLVENVADRLDFGRTPGDPERRLIYLYAQLGRLWFLSQGLVAPAVEGEP